MTATEAGATPAPPRSLPASELDPKRWWILSLCGLGQMMVVLDLTVINIALPKAQAALGFTNVDRQWVITAYALAFGGLLLLGGRLADRFGTKRTFIIGMAGFALASAVGGAAQSFLMLASARATQGVFAAILAPSTLSLLTTTFREPRERGKAFGIFGAIVGSGSAIGLLLGGALTSYLNWRFCLYINDLIAGVALTGAVTLLEKSVRNDLVHIDDPGIFIAVAGLVSLVFGFSQAATDGWGATPTVAPLAAALVLLAVFVLIEHRAAHPVLPLRVVLDRNRGGSYLTMLLLGIATFGVFLFLTYYFQVIAGYSAVRAGLAFAPMTVCVLLGSVIANIRLLPRFGARWVVTAAAILAGLAMLDFAQISAGTSYWSGVLVPGIVFGIGMGAMFGCCFNMATVGAGPQIAGVASAMISVGQQVGGSIGASFLNTIAASTAATYLVAHASPAFLAQQGQTITSTLVWRSAQLHSYDTAFYVAAAFILAAALGSAIVYPRHRFAAPASETTNRSSRIEVPSAS